MGDMVVLRDPNGFRPLCYAQDGPLFAAASESVPCSTSASRDVQSLEPGEMILIQDGEIRHERFAPRQTPSHCFFEWIYFANVASTLDDRSVYLTRAALGKELARQERQLGKVPLDARHHRRAGARHRQGRRRRDGLRAGRAVASRG